MTLTERGTSARVLVVDDTESNRYVLATWLRREGYDVVEATTGEEALAIAATQPLDLIVLDVNLPDTTGYAVCERVKADPHTAAVPVLHVSASAVQSADRSYGLRRGADGYLVEPVEREELVATVQALLRGAAAHRTANRLAWRLRQLNDATLAVNEAVSIEQLVAIIAKEACSLFGAAALVAVAADERGISAAASPGAPTSVTPCTADAVDAVRRAGAGTARITGTALSALADEPAGASYLFVAFDDPRGHRGMLAVEAQPAMADETEVVFTQYARAAATALKNMRTYNIERRIALTLQRSLLPDAAPRIPELDVAVRYEASAEHTEVGGDFYEIFLLGENTVALAIGDVVGHSLEAATVMAQLRTGIRSYLLEGHGPAATLERLNRLLCRFHPDATATACCVVYDRRTGRCEVANAGHPPPLVVSDDGVRYLPIGGPLLGVDATAQPPHAFTLNAGDVLLLFTDGLVERRNETIDTGLERLAHVAARKTANLDELCDRLLREAGPTSMEDDIALVAIRRAR